MKYAFFPGCSYNSAAGYRESVEVVCKAMEIELEEIPDWNCCGATALFSSDEFKGLILAGRILAMAQNHGIEEIITVCNACYTILRKTARMLSHERDILARVNKRLAREGLKLDTQISIRHLLDVFINDVPEDAWSSAGGSHKTNGLSVAGYYGCQLTRPWADLDHPHRPSLLERFIERLGYKAVVHSAGTLCCGASLSVPYKNACSLLTSRITEEVRAKGADLVTTICPLCQFNLDTGQIDVDKQPLPVTYFTQLAGLALGFKPEELGLYKLLIQITGF